MIIISFCFMVLKKVLRVVLSSCFDIVHLKSLIHSLSKIRTNVRVLTSIRGLARVVRRRIIASIRLFSRSRPCRPPLLRCKGASRGSFLLRGLPLLRGVWRRNRLPGLSGKVTNLRNRTQSCHVREGLQANLAQLGW